MENLAAPDQRENDITHERAMYTADEANSYQSLAPRWQRSRPDERFSEFRLKYHSKINLFGKIHS